MVASSRTGPAVSGGTKRKLVFLCGGGANGKDLSVLFTRVVYLHIDKETLQDRLQSRTGNDFGKPPHELEMILSWRHMVEDDYGKLGAVIVDGTQPLDHVDAVIDAASPGGS